MSDLKVEQYQKKMGITHTVAIVAVLKQLRKLSQHS